MRLMQGGKDLSKQTGKNWDPQFLLNLFECFSLAELFCSLTSSISSLYSSTARHSNCQEILHVYKYILKQWIVLSAGSDWLLKLGIASAIHL